MITLAVRAVSGAGFAVVQRTGGLTSDHDARLFASQFQPGPPGPRVGRMMLGQRSRHRIPHQRNRIQICPGGWLTIRKRNK